MNKRHFITTALASLLMVVCISCSKKEEKARRIVVDPPEEEQPIGTQRQEDQLQTEDVKWQGKTYHVSIERKADESLPLVDDGTGIEYYDNRIKVTVSRQDGSTFFERSYTKGDFASFVEQATLKFRSLYAISLHEVTDGAISLVACVGSPEISSDDFQLIEIRIKPDASTTVRPTTILDIEKE
ncbi:MAG: DUF4738 domain-containing protein [Prevotella sp.]|nr:DUF4738 domain-containing protein [Prevotella sp.]